MDLIFRPALFLICGRGAAFAVTFVVPIILARVLTATEFGTYKQLFLVYGTVFGIAQLGMAESLFYFLPSQPKNSGRYAANSMLVLAVAGVVSLTIVAGAGANMEAWLNNPALGQLAPLLGFYLALMLASAPLEIMMISEKRHAWASAAYALSEVTRAVLILAPVLVWRRLDALLFGAVVFALARLLAAVLYARFGVGDLRPDAALLWNQLRYAFPLQAAASLEILQANAHLYAVSLGFDSATFAIYAVGCMQIPLIDLIANSTCSVMMVQMSEKLRDGDRPGVIQIWSNATHKLALTFLPLIGLLFVVSADLVVFLFGDGYSGSVPVFRLWLLVLFFVTFQVHGVLRVYGDTRFLVLQNLLKFVIVVGLVGSLIPAFHLNGAVLAAIFAVFIGKSVLLVRLKHIAKIPLRHLLPWRSLAQTLMLAATAAVPPLTLRMAVDFSTLGGLFWTASIYAVGYASLAWYSGLLRRPEKTADGIADIVQLVK